MIKNKQNVIIQSKQKATIQKLGKTNEQKIRYGAKKSDDLKSVNNNTS